MEMLRNFLFEIAGCTSNFTVQNRQQTCVNEIREKVDKSKVLVSEAMRWNLWYKVMLHLSGRIQPSDSNWASSLESPDKLGELMVPQRPR